MFAIEHHGPTGVDLRGQGPSPRTPLACARKAWRGRCDESGLRGRGALPARCAV